MTQRLLCCLALTCLVAGQTVTTTQIEKAKPTPILWQNRGDVGSLDLYWGPGSPGKAPQPPFTFVKEDTSGTKPKVDVTDARGTLWSVKFPGADPADNEVHAEIAAARLTWALGYLVEESYFVPKGRIDEIRNLKRAANHIAPDGGFRTARFEQRPSNIVRTGQQWSFDKNPFVGSKELSGLKILTTLLGNWDASPRNTDSLQVSLPDGRTEVWYIVSDLGSTFGQMGLPSSFSKHTRWNPDDYRNERLLDWAHKDAIRLNYSGGASIANVPVHHARWFAELSSRLGLDQIKRAFEAAGASENETRDFAAAVVEKIAQLRAALDHLE